MVKKNINRCLFALMVTLSSAVLVACAQNASDKEPFSRQLAQLEKTQGQATVTEVCRLIDSLAVASPDSLSAMVRAFCRVLVAQQRTAEATSIAAYLWGVDAMETPEIASRLLTSTLLPGTVALHNPAIPRKHLPLLSRLGMGKRAEI